MKIQMLLLTASLLLSVKAGEAWSPEGWSPELEHPGFAMPTPGPFCFDVHCPICKRSWRAGDPTVPQAGYCDRPTCRNQILEDGMVEETIEQVGATIAVVAPTESVDKASGRRTSKAVSHQDTVSGEVVSECKACDFERTRRGDAHRLKHTCKAEPSRASRKFTEPEPSRAAGLANRAEPFKVGDKVEFVRDYDNGYDASAPKGTRGTIDVLYSSGSVGVQRDDGTFIVVPAIAVIPGPQALVLKHQERPAKRAGGALDGGAPRNNPMARAREIRAHKRWAGVASSDDEECANRDVQFKVRSPPRCQHDNGRRCVCYRSPTPIRRRSCANRDVEFEVHHRELDQRARERKGF